MSAPSPDGLLWMGLTGARLDRKTAALLERIRPAGVVLFRRNLESPAQCARLLAGVRRVLPFEPLLALDQEGEPVSRLRAFGFTFPSAHDMARAGRRSLMTRHAALTGRAMRLLGFNVDFAPVVDLSAPGAPNGIGERSFSRDPGRAVRWGRLYLDGLRREGVMGCLKHYPGLGRTRRDSHRVLPAARGAAALLRRRDMEPFRRLRRAAPFVMAAHAWYPALMKRRGPASLDERLVREILKKRWKYRGLVVADDLAMKAVPAWARERKPDAFLKAGCDLLLACEAGLADLVAGALRARKTEARPFAEESFRRLEALRRRCSKESGPPRERFSGRILDALARDSRRLAADAASAAH
jgi:beta-N-acetylhexosaminidase